MPISNTERRARAEALDLYERVAQFNPEAAEYLVNQYLRVPMGSTRADDRPGFRIADNLDTSMTWEAHNTDSLRWRDIHNTELARRAQVPEVGL